MMFVPDFNNPIMVQLLKRMSEIKRDFLRGEIDREKATKLVDELLHQHGLLEPDAIMELADMPEDFFQPCDCLCCKSERGECPLPLEAIVSIENLRLAAKMGMISMMEAMVGIKRILNQHNVSEAEALKLWNIPSPQEKHTMQVKPLQGEEIDFFAKLEEQMKDIPKEDKDGKDN